MSAGIAAAIEGLADDSLQDSSRLSIGQGLQNVRYNSDARERRLTSKDFGQEE